MSTENYLRIGFVGSHRVGKTSTAEQLSKTLQEHYNVNLPFLKTEVSKSFSWVGVNPSDHVSFGERIVIQKEIFSKMEKFFLQTTGGFITDRTPLDLMGYLLANIDSTTSSVFDEQVHNLKQNIHELTERVFDVLVYVPVSFPFIEEGSKVGKVYASYAYREAISRILYYDVSNFETKRKLVIKIPQSMNSFYERIDYIIEKLTKW